MNTDKKMENTIGSFRSFFRSLRMLFNLRSDTNESKTVETIRSNVDFKSANAWTLVFAIIIASVGLNTNSTAVIIGAMLISPLMGPILGMGLGLGINDFQLVRRSVRNLGYAVVISILASTLYFLISPLSEIQSELLSRTRPTFYDVLIALFGGAAGIVALSRHEKSNAIPGVAIATALMPPLCTAGYGIASGEVKYFLGATYLFVINTVFICIATFIFVRYLKFQKVAFAVHAQQRKIDRWVMIVAIVVVIPSLILAWVLQRESSFVMRANSFIEKEIRFKNTFVVGREVEYNWSSPKIKVDLIGETIGPLQIEILKEKIQRYGLKADTLELHQTSLEQNIEKMLSERLRTQNNTHREAEISLGSLQAELQNYKRNEDLSSKVSNELVVLFPKVEQVLLAYPAKNQKRNIRILWKTKPTKQERNKISDFISRRVDETDNNILHFLDI